MKLVITAIAIGLATTSLLGGCGSSGSDTTTGPQPLKRTGGSGSAPIGASVKSCAAAGSGLRVHGVGCGTGASGDVVLECRPLPPGEGQVALGLHGAALSLPLGQNRPGNSGQLHPPGALDLVRLETVSLDPRPASDSESLLVKWMGITDANSAGFVHGGMVMKLCDEAAGLAALRHCGVRIVTAAMDRMTFMHPVDVGELVTCRAKVNAAWRTSMEVGVRVEAEKPAAARPGTPRPPT